MKSIVSIYQNTNLARRNIATAITLAFRKENLTNLVKNLEIMGPKISLRNNINFVPSCIVTIRYLAREDLNLKPYKIPPTFKLARLNTKKMSFFVRFKQKGSKIIMNYFESCFYKHGV
jgi:hypothetical protein